MNNAQVSVYVIAAVAILASTAVFVANILDAAVVA